jgi:hypothetical protein
MIVTSMQLTTPSRRDIAVLQKESSSFEGEEDVNESLFGVDPRGLSYWNRSVMCMGLIIGKTDAAGHAAWAPQCTDPPANSASGSGLSSPF